MRSLGVMLVDDHLMFTEALEARLSLAPDLWVVGRWATGDPALVDIVARRAPDVLAIEVESLGSAIGEVIASLLKVRPEMRVVVLTSDHDINHVLDAVRNGVSAWVTKEQGAAELEDVLRGVCRGHSFFPPEMLGDILGALRSDTTRVNEESLVLGGLSRREREVLAAMTEGKGTREIAQEMVISVDTVRTHTRNLFVKLGVHSRLEAVSLARSLGVRQPVHTARLALLR